MGSLGLLGRDERDFAGSLLSSHRLTPTARDTFNFHFMNRAEQIIHLVDFCPSNIIGLRAHAEASGPSFMAPVILAWC